MEQRKYERIGLGIPLRLDVHQWEGEGAFKGQSYEGVLADLSEGGLRIITDVPLAEEMFLKIHFPKDAGLNPIIGRIIRIDIEEEKFHYGCMVTGLSLSDRKQLESYIRNRTEQ
jgi:hypothetical protein